VRKLGGKGRPPVPEEVNGGACGPGRRTLREAPGVGAEGEADHEARSARQWSLVLELFEESCDLPEPERAGFLDRACGGDARLRERVQDLLRADARSEGLDTSVADRLAIVVRDVEDRAELTSGHEGGTIGPYRLLRRVGAGGMGVVYLAERIDGQFEDSVCLKLLREGLDTEEVLRRFLQERQILAWLRHSNIASLLDGGLTAWGTPYLVMEHVDGVPITEYCDSRRLGLTARLRLFCQVCQGVQHAHANLVVHRDLKPSNVLVTPQGQVKLLDFGIAKLLGAGPGPEMTQPEERFFTPSYAAPEQLSGRPVTTATDVFSLGVVLYELLTGHHPFPGGAAGRISRPEGIEPAKPSSVVRAWMERARGSSGTSVDTNGGTNENTKGNGRTSEAPRDPVELSRDRGTVPRRLRRALAGDLDNILLKALAADPTRRYPSAAALEDDIERHLSCLPVQARRPAFRYRATRFLRRHRTGSIAAAAMLLTLLGGSGGVFWQARLAQREARRAEAVKDFMVSLFAAASPNAVKGQTISIPHMLDRSAGRIEKELAGQPEVQAEVLHVVGRLYHVIGSYAEAESLLARGLEIQESLYGPDDPRLIETLARLATVLQDRGDLEAGERHFRRAVDIARRKLPEDHPQLAYRVNDLSALLYKKGEIQEAERLQREVLDLKLRILGEEHPDVSTTMNNLATNMMERGEFDASEALLREVLRIRRKAYGDSSLTVANSMHNLSVLYRHRGNYPLAESLGSEVLRVRRQLVGDGHPSVAIARFSLAAIWHASGRPQLAGPAYETSIAALEAVLGSDHPDVAGMKAERARLMREQGHLAEAETITLEALGVVEQRLPRDHPYRARILLELGGNLTAQRRAAEAEVHLREAWRIRKGLYGRDGLPCAEAEIALGNCLRDLFRYEEAEAVLVHGLAVCRERLGDGHVKTVEAGRAVADLRAALP